MTARLLSGLIDVAGRVLDSFLLLSLDTQGISGMIEAWMGLAGTVHPKRDLLQACNGK